ncbi:MAG: phage tail tube protein [Roseococcus sp.]
MARFDAAVVLAMMESAYATDPVPTAAANAMLFQQVDWSLSGDLVDRPMVVPYMGNDPFSVVARGCMLSGELDLASSGTLGTAPAWGPLLRACGMAQTITASTRVDYTPISSAQESNTFYHYLDGTLHRGTGARGDFSIELVARQLPKLRVSLTALYNAPSAVGLPTPTLTAFQTPLAVEPVVTGTVSIGGNALPFSSFKYTHGNRLVRQEIPGRSRVLIEQRAPSLEITVEAPDAVSPNLFSMIGAVQNITLQHGQTAASIIDIITRGRVQPEPKYSRGPEGQVYLTLQIRPEPTSAGNDEFTLRVR